MTTKRIVHGVCTALIAAGCIVASQAAESAPNKSKTKYGWNLKKSRTKEAVVYPTFGSIERLDPALDALLAPDAKLEKLAEGFEWSEGPVWDKKQQAVLFSDVPRNTVYIWKEGAGFKEWLKPSGYTGKTPRGGEPGSNGLTMDRQGRLVLAQHGDRQVARLVKGGEKPEFKPLAQHFNYQRFNSPNDLVFMSNGDLYFTDPPYGLNGLNNAPEKELLFNGVYRVQPNGRVTLLVRDISFPNGIALSPDEKTLYVAVSDPRMPVVMAYSVQPDGTLASGRVFFNTASLMAGRKGVPDGLKVDVHGNLWCTGPGGVLIISPQGKHLGTINTGEATANCGWGDDGTTLYITADMYLARVKTKVKGFGF
ncbi:MAG TPA: SMP-30/gluconolactonase/LRE family protein [Methylomirabilota bacterium]|nr:SMP-30/gluconolactonase/LRE family protein [Methylomirabilota bacterium]